MALVEPGNKMPLGSASPNSSMSREKSIVEKTRTLAFPTGEILPMENFEHKGDKAAGTHNSVQDMCEVSGKTLQESYRAGLPESAAYTDKVADR